MDEGYLAGKTDCSTWTRMVRGSGADGGVNLVSFSSVPDIAYACRYGSSGKVSLRIAV